MQCSILDFGAVADGVTLCTEAIRKAIQTVADAGGGYVVVPAGRFLTGTVRLLSHVYLLLEPGSVLLGPLELDPLEELAPDEPGARERCLVGAIGQHDCGIVGAGTLDLQRRGTHKKYGTPLIVVFYKCERISMRGIRLVNPGSFTTYTKCCVDVNYEGLELDSTDCENGDGLDFAGGRNVTISNCILRCGDDAIGLKTFNNEYPCENFAITNCVVHSNWAAIRLGPESGGDMRNITVSNCVFNDCSDGFKVQIFRSHTHFEDLTFSNINMVNVKRPFFFTNSGHTRTPSEYEELGLRRPVIRRVQINNVNAGFIQTEHDWFEEMCVLTGCPDHGIEDISISNLYVRARGFGKQEWAENMEVPSFIEYATRYPDVVWHHWTSACLFIRYAKNVRLTNCFFEATNPDARPAVEAECVDGFSMAQAEQRNCGALLQYHRVKDLRLQDCDGEVKALTPELEARWERYYADMRKEQKRIANTDMMTAYIRKGTVLAECPLPATEAERAGVTFPFTYSGGTVYARVDRFECSIRILVNGRIAFDWNRPKDYQAFCNVTADITGSLESGENEIRVECYGEDYAKLYSSVRLMAPPDEPLPSTLYAVD